MFAGAGQATGSFRLAIVARVLVAFVPVRRALVAAGSRPPEVR